MKKNIAVLILALFAGTMIAQNGAYVEFKMTSSKGANGTMKGNYSDFGSTSEISMVIPQMPGGGFSSKAMTQKSNPDVIYVVNDKDKTYSERKRSDMNARDDAREYEVKKLGEETVNGYKCVHALVTEGKESHEVWNSKSIPDYEKYAESMKSNERMGNAKREKALRDAGCDGFPVKFVHKGNEREGDMTVELVKIEKKNFSKSDFEVPAGYAKSESPAMQGNPNMGMKSQQELMNMTPQERAKYVEEMKKKYGK
jgi:hypothetical protein